MLATLKWPKYVCQLPLADRLAPDKHMTYGQPVGYEYLASSLLVYLVGLDMAETNG